MKSERVIVLVLIWTKWIPHVVQKHSIPNQKPPCLSSRNVDGLLIATTGQPSGHSEAAVTAMRGAMIQSTLHVSEEPLQLRDLRTRLTQAN